MKLTLEQQKENLVNSYKEMLKVFKKFESLNKYVPAMERAYKQWNMLKIVTTI